MGARTAGSTAFTSGRNSRTVVPTPTSLVITTWPPDCLANPYTMLSPSPLPRPTSLVVKNGSNTCVNTPGGMPLPLSDTVASK